MMTPVRKSRVLLVEDDQLQRHRVTGILSARGYEVIAVENAPAAMSISLKGITTVIVDLILGDDHLAGAAVIKYIRARRSQCQIIAFTAMPGVDESSLRALGADELVRKPADNDLNAATREIEILMLGTRKYRFPLTLKQISVTAAVLLALALTGETPWLRHAVNWTVRDVVVPGKIWDLIKPLL